jgi:orotidine 5'-phosphate decarboxylase subfamily 2
MKKNSILCVGLDPEEKELKKLGYDTSIDYIDQAILDFTYKIIENTGEYACAFKPNRQFILPLSLKQTRKLNKKIHDYDCISICDHKLSDIGSTNLEGIINIKKERFDAFTYCPFLGNIEEATQQAHENDLGILSLIIMSNPEAEMFMKSYLIKDLENDKPIFGYEIIAKKLNKINADGGVVGATGHVTPEDLKRIRNNLEYDKVLLVPGVGAQGGDEEKVIKYGGGNILITVRKSIIYQNNPREKARVYMNRFNKIRKTI